MLKRQTIPDKSRLSARFVLQSGIVLAGGLSKVQFYFVCIQYFTSYFRIIRFWPKKPFGVLIPATIDLFIAGIPRRQRVGDDAARFKKSVGHNLILL